MAIISENYYDSHHHECNTDYAIATIHSIFDVQTQYYYHFFSCCSCFEQLAIHKVLHRIMMEFRVLITTVTIGLCRLGRTHLQSCEDRSRKRLDRAARYRLRCRLLCELRRLRRVLALLLNYQTGRKVCKHADAINPELPRKMD